MQIRHTVLVNSTPHPVLRLYTDAATNTLLVKKSRQINLYREENSKFFITMMW